MTDQPHQIQPKEGERVVANKIIINTLKPVGSGSFGTIFRGKVIETGEDIAIKVEKRGLRNSQLLHEAQLYKHLRGGEGIPNVRWFGIDNSQKLLVMDLLGPSLEHLFYRCQCHFSIKTVLMIADQIITRIEYLHQKHFIHRDIKPENFLIGRRDRTSTIFLIDLGLAKQYRDPRTKQHIPYRETSGITGTFRYISLNMHHGVEQSRRDDMESIGYVLIYFLKGHLPWQGIKTTDKREKANKIRELKDNITVEELCHGLPNEFTTYLHYVRDLSFDEQPNYDYVRSLFRQCMASLHLVNDGSFDWTQVHSSRTEPTLHTIAPNQQGFPRGGLRSGGRDNQKDATRSPNAPYQQNYGISSFYPPSKQRLGFSAADRHRQIRSTPNMEILAPSTPSGLMRTNMERSGPRPGVPAPHMNMATAIAAEMLDNQLNIPPYKGKEEVNSLQVEVATMTGVTTNDMIQDFGDETKPKETEKTEQETLLTISPDSNSQSKLHPSPITGTRDPSPLIQTTDQTSPRIESTSPHNDAPSTALHPISEHHPAQRPHQGVSRVNAMNLVIPPFQPKGKSKPKSSLKKKT